MTRSPESTGNGHDEVATAPEPDTTPDVVRDMVRADRAAHPTRDDRSPGTTASADAVESLRRALRDLKHDVRMLKVGMDKQGQLLQYIATKLDRHDAADD